MHEWIYNDKKNILDDLGGWDPRSRVGEILKYIVAFSKGYVDNL